VRQRLEEDVVAFWRMNVRVEQPVQPVELLQRVGGRPLMQM
jgi:hypothetical protein